MRMAKASPAEEFQLITGFEAVRKTLLAERFRDRLQQPLAYWALPNDRRLPVAFLGRTLHDLLQTPFDQLSATPGIGQKKIASLVKLLHRATSDQPPRVAFGLNETAANVESRAEPAEAIETFDPALVSEALWAKWRDTIRRHHVGQETLGRLASTLQNLPTVIWYTPLNKYLNYTVAEIRELRTHGEKRVRAVLEVFHSLHDALSGARQPEHLSLRLSPTFVPALEAWIADVLAHPGVPTVDEFREKLVLPLVEQLKIDGGDQVYDLARGRLGLQGTPQSVRQQARRMGVTRARIYQLLDDCSKVFHVRWPEGKMQLDALAQKFATDKASPEKLQLFNAIRELLYPSRYEEVRDNAFDATV
jgi:hypothetical protein